MTHTVIPVLAGILVIAGCAICGCSHRVPAATMILVDPSGSVTEWGRHDEFAAVAALIPEMKRGDSLVMIPITENAAADIQGRVLKLRAPNQREAYDADLRRFRDDADRRFSVFSADLLAHPGHKTDILGALDVARQEFDAIPGSGRRQLIVLSDFLEDDGAYQFSTDQRLLSPEASRQFARQLCEEYRFVLHGVNVYLGGLDSREFGILGSERQNAVRTFWSTYFGKMGARQEIQSDGTGMVTQFRGCGYAPNC